MSRRSLLVSNLLYISLALACAKQPVVQTNNVPTATPAPTLMGEAIPLSGQVPSTQGEFGGQSGAIAPVASPSPVAPLDAPGVPSSNAPASGSPGRGFVGGGVALSGRVSSVEEAMRDLGARTVGNEIRVDLPSDVLFDFDKYDIRPDAEATLNKLLAIIQAQSGGGTIRIEGHTDSIASDAYNQRLSERRANAVKEWLAARGVARSRMLTRGFGERRPRAPNTNPDGSDNPEGRQLNRRVEIFIARG